MFGSVLHEEHAGLSLPIKINELLGAIVRGRTLLHHCFMKVAGLARGRGC